MFSYIFHQIVKIYIVVLFIVYQKEVYMNNQKLVKTATSFYKFSSLIKVLSLIVAGTSLFLIVIVFLLKRY